MKKTFSRAFAVVIALALTLTAAGCGTRVEEQSVWVEGEDTVQTITHSSGTNSGGTNSGGTNSGDKNSGSSKKETVSTNSDGITNVEGIDKTNDKKYNLKGATVTIGYYKAGDGGKPNPSTSTYQDEVKLISEIEKKYNCKIEFKDAGATGSTQFYGLWTAAAQAGTKFCDILQISTAVVFPTHMKAGYLTKLDGYLDLDSVIYNQTAMKQTAIKGKHYITVMSNRLYDTFGFYYNRKIFDAFGVDYPDKYVKANKWTWDTFVEIAKIMTNSKNGVQYYGYAYQKSDGGRWATSNGTQRIIEKNGKYIFNMGSESYLKALDFTYDLYNVHKVVGGNWEEGSAAMVFGRPNFGAGYMESLGANNVGFTYAPKGPDAKDFNVAVTETTSWAIPSTVKNPEVMAKILYDLTYPYKWRRTLLEQQEGNFNDSTSLEVAMDICVKGNENIRLEPLYSYIREISLSGFGIEAGLERPRGYIESVASEAQAELDSIWGQ